MRDMQFNIQSAIRKASVSGADSCKKEYHKRRMAKGREYSKLLFQANILKRDVAILTCVHCGKKWKTRKHKEALYCSGRCANAAAKIVRRIRKRGAMVAPVHRAHIIERDKGICKLCDEPIDLSLTVPHPMSLTLDHIIPLARGGTHEPSNVQLAHFICNSRKSDTLAGMPLAKSPCQRA